MGKLAPERQTSLDFSEARDDTVDHMQTTSISLQTGNHARTSLLDFYMTDALPDTQPIGS